VFSYSSSLQLANCTLSDNSAGNYGGGMSSYMATPALTNCTLSGNTSGSYGGGMYNYRAAPALTNCTLSGNTGLQGGGMASLQSLPEVTNCTFYGNTAIQAGGGLANILSWPSVTNSVLWADIPNEIHDWDSVPAVTHSDIEGGYPGEGNIDAAPLFADPDSGDFHLLLGSPCIDAGTNEAPGLPEYDYEGDPRILASSCTGSGVVDMGADEVVPPQCTYLPAVLRTGP
jgi:hypothetical protein